MTFLTGEAIEAVYAGLEYMMPPSRVAEFFNRHGVESMQVLTVTCEHDAALEVSRFKERIRDKTVVEIGAGTGYLALEMAKHAKTVWAIEADPVWSWVFTLELYLKKQPNLTWIFGTAESLIGQLHADIAVVYTRSGKKAMLKAASGLADEVIAPEPMEAFRCDLCPNR